jgi:maltose alpha-D-glucosyltransferase/alpha-amylase
MSNWYSNAIFYELYLRAFADGNNDGHGDFTGLLQKLDYLEWLGVDCIWILPMYPSPLKDDGYDVASYYGIHPQYGYLEDFQMTVSEIHSKRMRVIIDLVLNHTSDQHPWFQQSRSSQNSPWRDFYVWSQTQEKYQGASIIFSDVETSNWTYDAQTGEYYWHRFYSSQPDLNYDNPQVRQAMLDAIQFWLDIGADGFRVDAVPYLFEREGTYENLPETHGFIQDIRQLLDAQYPDAVLLAEACMPPEQLLQYFGEGNEFQMAFHFPLMSRLYLALAKADRSCVVEVLENTPQLPKGCQWATFLRNHDELNFETVAEDLQFLLNHYAPDKKYHFANRGIVRRLAPLMGNDRRKIELMHSLLLTLPGAPVLYYGDEIGTGDDISLPDRHGVRTPMQWNSTANAGFSQAEKLYNNTRVVSDPVYGYTKVNVEAQKSDPNSLLQTVRKMIVTRKRLPVLASGKLQWLENLPPQALCFRRTSPDASVLALHNLSEAPLTVKMPVGAQLEDALAPSAEPLRDSIILPAYGYRWLSAGGVTAV